MGPIHMRCSRGGAEGQRGQIVILFALMLVLLMGLAAIVVDVGVLRRSTAELATSVDSGALAGGAQLPATSTNATTITTSAVSYLNANYPGLSPAADSSWITYLCLVGLANGLPDGSQIPAVCDPGSPAKTSLNCSTWRCGGGVATAPCVPSVGSNKCNVIVVKGSANVAYRFGPAIGVGSGSTGTIQSAACQGACGGPPTVPVDLALILDRTGSMSGNYDDLALAANTVLQIYNPAIQWVSLGTLGPSSGTTTCTGVTGALSNAAGSDPGSAYPANRPNWMPVGLSGTGTGVPVSDAYVNASGTLNASSPIVKAIKCIGLGENSSTGTNLSSPLRIARQYLPATGRAGVKKGIIFETDGTPNRSSTGTASDYTCAAASNEAALAKAAGIEVFTVGFGDAATETCPDGSSVTDTAGKHWSGLNVYKLLDAMASGPAVGTPTCTNAENIDGDHFFCKTDPATLKDVFKSAATILAAGARLIALP